MSFQEIDQEYIQLCGMKYDELKEKGINTLRSPVDRKMLEREIIPFVGPISREHIIAKIMNEKFPKGELDEWSKDRIEKQSV